MIIIKEELGSLLGFKWQIRTQGLFPGLAYAEVPYFHPAFVFVRG